jgi:hypothetical protein
MKKITLSLTTLALAATFGLASIAPASADQAAATRNTILGAAALIAGIAIESNVSHKNAVANTVEGYTQDGATVYQDGHVIESNGSSYYPGNVGQSISCNGTACSIYGANNNGYNGYNGYNGNNGRGRWHR